MTSCSRSPSVTPTVLARRYVVCCLQPLLQNRRQRRAMADARSASVARTPATSQHRRLDGDLRRTVVQGLARALVEHWRTGDHNKTKHERVKQPKRRR